MIGHLGTRVSALLDGQLSDRETEEAWSHVYTCHACRDLVEREGWVKTRLAGLHEGERGAPSGLKGSLLSLPPGEALLAGHEPHGPHRRMTGAVMLGGSAIGAAMLGVIALGFAPGSGPPADRRPPVSQINTTVPTPSGSPGTGTGGTGTVGPSRVPGLTPVSRMLP
ncbi:anti-sigma factor family protein [Nocardioides sp. BYT-33-1]|uniref:anti-sigma factor family protein n=1 Tax=Nocardioides sp. BYT-33-1 TaxID=3416952 RepID=UPI003F52E606